MPLTTTPIEHTKHNTSKNISQNNKAWPKREDLPLLSLLVPPLPEELLPESIKNRVIDIAKRMAIPIEIVASLMLGTISSLIGRQVEITPKQYDDWSVIPMLWVMIIAPPSKKKTPALSEVLKSLEILETKAEEKYQKESIKCQVDLSIYEAKVTALKDKIREAAKNESEAELTLFQSKIHELKEEFEKNKVTERRYRTSDATVQKLAELLIENPNGILLLRDELSGWLNSLEQFDRGGDREFYLEAFNGKGRYRVDRIGRGCLSVPALYVSIMGGIQPGKLNQHIFAATCGGRGNDGLLQRFNMAIYPDKINLPYIDCLPDKDAYERVNKIFLKLDDIKSNFPVSNHSSSIPFLKFSSDGQLLFNEWITKLETRLNEENLDPSIEAHLGKYRALMPTLSLIFHLIDWADGNTTENLISLNATKLAAAWCDYLELHAKKMYSVTLNQESHSAHELAKKIKQGKIKNGTSVRDIYRNHWKWLKNKEDVEKGLMILKECHWIKAEYPNPTNGRPSSEIIILHPDLRNEAENE